MNERYRYKKENNCFFVIDREKQNEKKLLCNFVAEILEEEERLLDNGNTQVRYKIKGQTKKGEPLGLIDITSNEFEQGKWFSKYWGRKAELNDLDQPKSKVLKHIQCAISKYSKNAESTHTSYLQTGFQKTKSDEYCFLFENGAVTSEGIVNTVSCTLPKRMQFYHLPETFASTDQTTEAIKAVFNLLDFSKTNPCLGLLLSTAAIRAVVSVWLPVEEYVFLVGPKHTFKTSTVKIVQSFFGSWDINKSLLSWESTSAALESFAIKSRNGVLCVDDFVYPDVSNRRNEFTVKAEQFLRSVANRSPRERANNHGHALDSDLQLNCLVVSTGEHPPRNVNESLHQRGVYFPVKLGDIDTDTLSKAQNLANQGIFAQALIAFIQYLLGDFEKNKSRAEKWFKRQTEVNKRQYNLSDRDASHMASFGVAWTFFRKFAESTEVITHAESAYYKKQVNSDFGALMTKQTKIYSTDIGVLFIKGLRKAMKEGRAHVTDAVSGMQPTGVDPAKVGWQSNKRNGLWVGWRRPKQRDIFICGNIDIDELIALLPEHDRPLFSNGPKRFWKDLKMHKILICKETGRNSSRAKIPAAQYGEEIRYHVSMKVFDNSSTADSALSAKPNEDKSEQTSKKSEANKVDKSNEALRRSKPRQKKKIAALKPIKRF
ncbi:MULTISPECIES: hypothetical protein [Methylomonas]|uniref:DUF927 domain-containing protein n=2 Tax=Methylomonas TaxID=416 RepID=A0A126T2M4_9GAMM|nr:MULTISPECIES: hypothetical protein [Methylomonas]AMK75964.1 hypothetical protein JT25_005575 [Methylomonas denitrificans]OAI02022.1 hypothetical protein A1342_03545 [Methylomonas methanica]TCV84017.1 hypothetical protein EDE11_108149 [Methylomonas methanica]